MKKYYLFLLLITCFSMILASCRNLQPQAELSLYQLDFSDMVAESWLITAPDGQVTLLDAGFPQQAELDLFPLLKKHNLTHIDTILISHPHDDHFGGIPALLRNPDFTVGRICWGPLPPETFEPYDYDGEICRTLQQEIQEEAENHHIPLIELHRGDIIDFGGGVKAEVLVATDPERTKENYINNQSLVFLMKYGRFSMLFTGDMGFEEEEELFASGKDFSCLILKLPHHAGAGSNSEKFLASCQAKYAFASMPEWLSQDERGLTVQNRLDKLGIRSLRCWQYPEAMIHTDGNKIFIFTDKHERELEI